MKMKKRPVVEFLLQLINFIFGLCGIVIVFYGIYCFIKWKHNAEELHHSNEVKYEMGHQLLIAVAPSKLLSHKLSTAWFIHILLIVGATLFVVSCFGYVGTASRSPCCLISYSILLIGLIIAEIGLAAFITFDHNWEKAIPTDRSDNFPLVMQFIKMNWKRMRWLALVALVSQVIGLLLAIYLHTVMSQAWYDSSDEESSFVSRSVDGKKMTTEENSISSIHT